MGAWLLKQLTLELDILSNYQSIPKLPIFGWKILLCISSYDIWSSTGLYLGASSVFPFLFLCMLPLGQIICQHNISFHCSAIIYNLIYLLNLGKKI